MFRLSYCLLLAFIFQAVILPAQVKNCFKLLDKNDFSTALLCFRDVPKNREDSLAAGFGILKASAGMNRRSHWFEAIAGYEKTLKAFDALDQKEQKKLNSDYKITRETLEQAYAQLFDKPINFVEKTPNSEATRDSFLNAVTVIPQAYKARFNQLMVQQKTNPNTQRKRINPAATSKKKPVYVDRQPPEGSKLEFVKGINTEGSEYIPVLSSDGKIMYFVGENRADNFVGEDVFFSERMADGSWSEPKIDRFFSGTSYEAVVSMSADGNNLVLFIGGKPFISNKTKTGWTEPRPILLRKSYYWIGMTSITRNGEALIFESKIAPDSDINICVALRTQDGGWGIPFDLGSPINTSANERTPFLHSDFKTLYFSSNGHGGFGSYDVFKSTRLDDTWKNWPTPENLGPEINTAKEEVGFCIPPAGDMAYLATSSGFGDLDIMRIPLSVTARPEAQIVITGTLTDGSGQPLSGSITVEDAKTSQVIQTVATRPDGNYSFSIPKTAQINYFATGDSLITTKKTFVDAATYQGDVAEEKVEITTFKEAASGGKALELRDLLFDFAKSDLRPDARAELKRIYTNIKNFQWAIEIGGHTDNVGSDESNLQLSTSRAKAVRDFLVEQGYPANKISFKGYGSSMPITEKATEAGRARNRRVEIRVVK